MSSTKGKTDPQRVENDLYETEQWVIDILVSRIDQRLHLHEYEKIVDVGAGDGRIGQELYRKFQAEVHEAMWPRKVMIDIHEPCERQPEEEWLIGDFQKMDLGSIILNQQLACMVVGNPPYSLADEIVMECVETVQCQSLPGAVAIFLLRLNWLGSEGRAHWVDTHPPTHLTVVAPRPSFCVRETVQEDGKVKKTRNDSCEYAWIWWENGKPGIADVGVWPLDKKQRREWRKRNRGEL